MHLTDHKVHRNLKWRKKAILRNCCITPDGRRCLKQTMKDKENLAKQKREKEEVPGKGEFTETMLITHKGFSQYTEAGEKERKGQ